MRYVDEQRPDSGQRLWPTDPELQVEAEHWFSHGMLNEDAAPGSSFGNSIPSFTLPILTLSLKRQPVEAVEKHFAKHPLQERGQFFVHLRNSDEEFPLELFEQPARELCNGLLRLERTIARTGGPWALGDFSLVDVTMMACFHRFEDVCLDVVLQEPALEHLWPYWERLQARASYKSAVTDWHDAEIWRPIVAESERTIHHPAQSKSIRPITGNTFMPNLTRLIPFAFCSVLLTLPTLPTNAHHSYAQFDQNVCNTVEGVVKKWEFTYPHTWLWVTTKGPDDSDVLYGFEGTDPSSVAILGWTHDILFKGDKVSVAYNPM